MKSGRPVKVTPKLPEANFGSTEVYDFYTEVVGNKATGISVKVTPKLTSDQPKFPVFETEVCKNGSERSNSNFNGPD